MPSDPKQAKGKGRKLFEKGHHIGRPPGARNRATTEIKEFFHSIYTDPSYQASLRRRIMQGKAPALELYGMQLIYGKPRETHDVPGLQSLADALKAAITGRRADGQSA